MIRRSRLPVLSLYGALALFASASAGWAEEPGDGPDAALGDLVALYRTSLRRIADADPARGELLQQLAEAESKAVGEDWQKNMPRIARAELGVAYEIADRDLEALLPVVMLHHDLYLAQRAVPRPTLAFHAVEMAQQLAETYAKRGGTAGSRVVAARVMVSLAGHLQRGGSTLSLDLFLRAAELDPRNEAAWLGVAAFWEKRGGPYEQVAAPLRKLLESRPESREGQLRLGINLLRLGEAKEGADLLAKLFAGPENDWITSLAAQELARYDARVGRLADAVAVAEQAAVRMSGDQKLQVLLSYLYDRAGRPPAALRIAERAVKLPPGEATRGRYNAWPQSALAQDRRALSEGTESRLPMLSRVMVQSSPGGGS